LLRAHHPARSGGAAESSTRFAARSLAEKRGGRKRCLDSIAGLQENFESVLRDHTAGNPMRAEVQWTNLTLAEIAGHLVQHGTPVSVTVVRQLLKHRGYVKRKAQKRQALGHDKDRDRQFQNIARLRAEYEGSPNPIVSLDTKKKELIGMACSEAQTPKLLRLASVIAGFSQQYCTIYHVLMLPNPSRILAI
jgi:hypothetical protein